MGNRESDGCVVLLKSYAGHHTRHRQYHYCVSAATPWSVGTVLSTSFPMTIVGW
jgi:hypothetical protein